MDQSSIFPGWMKNKLCGSIRAIKTFLFVPYFSGEPNFESEETMNPKNPRLFFRISLVVLTLLFACSASTLFASRSVSVVSASNFTLSEGENIHNTLLLLSQNVTLAEESSVDGSVIMLCCNLTVDGKVNGDVYLLTGNLTIDVHADVEGEVGVLSGNLTQ
jgi:hypothetical protein